MQIPKISPVEMAERLKNGERLALLDVREVWEWSLSKLAFPQVVYLPLSILATQGEPALRTALGEQHGAPLVVICHHGIRSAQVTVWLQSLGWKEVFSLSGGLEAYAQQVDASIGRY